MKENGESLEKFMERFVLARSRLLRQEPFLGFLALELPTYFFGEAEEPTLTAATDGCHYFYNYNWCRQLTDAELVFVIAHEVAHVVSLHMLRRGDRENNPWNAACDFAINGMLVASCAVGSPLTGVAAMPSITDPRTRRPEPIGLWDDRFINWTAESIYDELERSATDLRLNWDQLLEPGVDREKAEAEAHARAAVAKSLIRAREHRQQHDAGDKPGGWERLAEAGLYPKVRWQDRLRRRALSWGFDSISWDRPNRKYRPHGFYFPRHRGYQLPDILFAFDTSGSVSDQFLGQMIAELNGLLTMARNSVVRVVCCDTVVQVVGDFHAGRRLDPQQHKLRGGGGTDFRPVFDYARQEKRFRQVIYLTDTMGIYPEPPPQDLNTLWLVPHDMADKPPFGEVIPLPFAKRQI
jgi:predicted metal-dependent peptidase